MFSVEVRVGTIPRTLVHGAVLVSYVRNELWPEGVQMWVGGVDAETDANGMIKPGLGDMGDRLFLTSGKS